MWGHKPRDKKMTIDQNKPNLKTERTYGCLILIARIALTISSTLLLTSIILLLLYKGECFSIYSHAGDIIWPTIIMTIYSLFYSFIMLLVFVIYSAHRRNFAWASIKKETLLFTLTGLLLTIFYFVNSYMISNHY